MRKTITIDGTNISDKEKSYIVAEIGLNHNKDIELAKKMVKIAKQSGANAVKFQTYITEKLLLQDSPAYNIFKDLELNEDEFYEISKYCKEIGITFFSTPLCYEAIDLLEKLDVPCYKIASMDLNNYEFIHSIAKTGKPIILSTGMGLIGEIEKAVNTIYKTGNDNIIILHCISKYPPKPEELNLKMIEKLKTIFPEYQIGFSDHSEDNTACVIARTLGANLFEKHFTLSKSMKGPDHNISCEPKDFEDLIKKLDIVDQSLRTQIKERFDSNIALLARRSLYSCDNYPKGVKITKDMIKIVRPGDGIAPEYLPLFLGRELKKDIKKDQKLDLSFI